MTTAAIRQKLHAYLDSADDKKIKAMYTLLENDMGHEEYSDEFKAELEEREEYYKKGGKMVSASEANKQINAALKK